MCLRGNAIHDADLHMLEDKTWYELGYAPLL